MLTSFTVEGYRKFSSLKIDNISRINLFLGNNNTGKTTLLESIYNWTLGCRLSPLVFGSLQRFKNFNMYSSPYFFADCIYSSFNDHDSQPLSFSFSGEEIIKRREEILKIEEDIKKKTTFTHKVILSDLYENNSTLYRKKNEQNGTSIPSFIQHPANNSNNFGNNGYLFSAPPLIAQWNIQSEKDEVNVDVCFGQVFDKISKPHCVSYFVSMQTHSDLTANMNFMSQIKFLNLMPKLREEVKEAFPEVLDLDYIPCPDGGLGPLYVELKNKKEKMPIYTMGEGFQKYVFILMLMVVSENGIVCLDEVDSGLHYSCQDMFCSTLLELSKKYNVQVFMATHNLEFLDTLLNSAYKIEHSKLESAEEEKSVLDSIRVITLKECEGNLYSISRSGNEAHKFRETYDRELR